MTVMKEYDKERAFMDYLERNPDFKKQVDDWKIDIQTKKLKKQLKEELTIQKNLKILEKIIILRYENNETLEKIGKKFSVTRESIRQRLLAISHGKFKELKPL